MWPTSGTLVAQPPARMLAQLPGKLPDEVRMSEVHPKSLDKGMARSRRQAAAGNMAIICA